jgi:hypothetical protein
MTSAPAAEDPVRRTARVEVDEDGDWWLTVEGTEIRRKLWNDRNVECDFPAASMGHRLIECGYMPDRSAMKAEQYETLPEKLHATLMGGWDGDPKSPRGPWTIPCHQVF